MADFVRHSCIARRLRALAGADAAATGARTFGISEAHVYRRLALAVLPAPVLDALKAGEITLGTAKAFTIAHDEALAAFSPLGRSCIGSGNDIR